jgi:AraC-like DNA-binding protein
MSFGIGVEMGGGLTRRDSQYIGASAAPMRIVREGASTAERIGTKILACRQDSDSARIGAEVSPIGVRAAYPVQAAAEPISRLAIILRELHCAAVIRVIRGVAVPAIPPVQTDHALAEQQYTLSVPIHDPQGRASTSLEVTLTDDDHPNVSRKALQAITESTASTIAEQWFRIYHQRDWVLAAQAANDQDRIILAVDRNRQLAGADHGARQYLREIGVNWTEDLGISALFESNALEDIWRARQSSSVLTIYAAADGARWKARITAPGSSDRRSIVDPLQRLQYSLPEAIAVAVSPTMQVQPPTAGLPSHTLRHIEEFIEARMESGIEIEDLAMTVRCSRSHFHRAFRRSYGVSPHRYLMYRRLSRAQDLLKKTDLSLIEIAGRAGYADQSHLCRIFRRFLGITPRAFRLQYRGYEVKT